MKNRKLSVKTIYFLLLGGYLSVHATSLAQVAPPINVEPAFRTTPIWYWENNNSECVPVPSYDVISRIGPQRIGESNISSDAKSCVLTLQERKLIAVLQCEGKRIEKF